MENFLKLNLNKGGNLINDFRYKDGIINSEFFDESNIKNMNSVYQARFLYLRNLVLKEPKPFNIPEIIESSEKALMYLSWNNFEQAIKVLEIDIKYKIIGVEVISKTGIKLNRLFIFLYDKKDEENEINEKFNNKYNSNSKSDNNMIEFKNENYNFKGLYVKHLEYKELIFLYIKMKELYFNEDNKILLKTKMCAFLERVFFEYDKLNYGFLSAFELLRAEFKNEIKGLEKCFQSEIIINEKIFLFPIIFKNELEIQIGLSLIELLDYSAGYEYLKKYSFFKEKIYCLIKMKNSEGAIYEIKKWINTIEFESNEENKIILSNLYIKLGHLLNDVNYFDLAGKVFNSSKPYKVKGLWMYKKKRFLEAEIEFCKALKITACDEETIYLYAHTLMKVEKYIEALHNFKMLNGDKINKKELSKSLSYCYFKIGELEESLKSLKSAALEDKNILNRYVFMSVRNGFIENVKWALKRMYNDTILLEIINYILQYKIILEKDLFECLNQNQNLTEIEIIEIISNFKTF